MNSILNGVIFWYKKLHSFRICNTCIQRTLVNFYLKKLTDTFKTYLFYRYYFQSTCNKIMEKWGNSSIKSNDLLHSASSSTCALTGFFWLLSHVIYLKLTRELQECLLSQASIFEWWITVICTQKTYLALWQNCCGQFITQKFSSLKSIQFSQFFLVRGKYERIDKI